MSTRDCPEFRDFVDDCLDKEEQAVSTGSGFATTDDLLRRPPLVERGPTKNAFRKSPAVMSVVALSGLLTLMVLLVVRSETSSVASSSPRSSRTSNGGQSKSMDLQEITFSQGVVPFDLSPDGDKQWDVLVPEHNGFIYADGPDGQQLLHGISMFHQLHCLRMIRDLLQDFEGLSESAGEDPGRVPQPNVHLHILHCFDYLVQGILCAADGTLEPTLPNNTVVTGYDVAHQCQDKDRLWELVESSRSKTHPSDGV